MNKGIRFIVLAISLSLAANALAVETIDGKIVKIDDGTVTIQIDSEFVPNRNDKVEIGRGLPGLDFFDTNALGMVREVTGNIVVVKVFATFDPIERFHVARITCETPATRGQPSTTGGPGDARVNDSQGGDNFNINGTTTTIRIPANKIWTETGLLFREGDTLTITASGTVEAAGQAETRSFYHAVSPNGRDERFDYFPDRNLPALSLVGMIGDGGSVFFVGESLRLTVGPNTDTVEGHLRLAINDDDVSDNQGAWLAQITIERGTSSTEEQPTTRPETTDGGNAICFHRRRLGNAVSLATIAPSDSAPGSLPAEFRATPVAALAPVRQCRCFGVLLWQRLYCLQSVFRWRRATEFDR
jgi:hypothetical protein